MISPRSDCPRSFTWTRRAAASALAAVTLAGAAGLALPRPDPLASIQDAPTPQPAPIDGTRAYGYLKAICALGRRPAGSAANEKQRAMVAEHFKAQGGTVTEQPFTARDPMDGRVVRLANLIGSWHPERTERVVLCAHYDTRPFADQEFDPIERRKPFLGANDGASGVALLMEIAHHLNELPTPFGVDLVLFDAEELVYGQGGGEYFLGSKEFARRYRAMRRSTSRDKKFTYVAGILFDMVGGKDLRLPREPNSDRYAPRLVDQIWAVARWMKAPAFVDEVGREVLDDHLPLNEVGIPTIDIIDFEYPHWHRASDLPENCAPDGLEQVGKVVTAWLALPRPSKK